MFICFKLKAWSECLAWLCVSAGQISGGSSTLHRGAYVSPTDDLKYNQVWPKSAERARLLRPQECLLGLFSFSPWLIISDSRVSMENLQYTPSSLNFLQPLSSSSNDDGVAKCESKTMKSPINIRVWTRVLPLHSIVLALGVALLPDSHTAYVALWLWSDTLAACQETLYGSAKRAKSLSHVWVRTDSYWWKKAVPLFLVGKPLRNWVTSPEWLHASILLEVSPQDEAVL